MEEYIQTLELEYIDNNPHLTRDGYRFEDDLTRSITLKEEDGYIIEEALEKFDDFFIITYGTDRYDESVYIIQSGDIIYMCRLHYYSEDTIFAWTPKTIEDIENIFNIIYDKKETDIITYYKDNHTGRSNYIIENGDIIEIRQNEMVNYLISLKREMRNEVINNL